MNWKSVFGQESFPTNLDRIYELAGTVSLNRSQRIRQGFLELGVIRTSGVNPNKLDLDVDNLPEITELNEMGINIDSRNFSQYDAFLNQIIEVDTAKFNIIDNIIFFPFEIKFTFQYKAKLMMDLLQFDNIKDLQVYLKGKSNRYSKLDYDIKPNQVYEDFIKLYPSYIKKQNSFRQIFIENSLKGNM